jgi:hypothetical protein
MKIRVAAKVSALIKARQFVRAGLRIDKCHAAECASHNQKTIMSLQDRNVSIGVAIRARDESQFGFVPSEGMRRSFKHFVLHCY